MKTCGVCRRKYSAAGALVHIDDGGLRAVRACADCATRALRIAVPVIAECACGAAPVHCTACRNVYTEAFTKERQGIPAAIERLTGLVKAHRSGSKAGAGKSNEALAAWVEGVESAIDLLKSGRF